MSSIPRSLIRLGAVVVLGTCAAAAPQPNLDFSGRVARVLASTPLIDGHNDLAEVLSSRFDRDFTAFDLSADTSKLPVPAGERPISTDIPRLRAGHVGGQFWSVWVSPTLKGLEAVQATLEQIDLVVRLTARYPKDLAMAHSAADIRRIHRAGQVASLIGVEGGHQINNSLAVLRQMYALGARYMTLTHTLNNDWADAATDTPVHHGLTPFGREVIREMNRLGMLVDLSHVSPAVMQQALAISEAPVMFSHSAARALNDHPRNVADDVLAGVRANGGIVMVVFYPAYVSDACRRWDADHDAERARYSTPPYGGLFIGQPERAQDALLAWERAHPSPVATIGQVADHIEYVRKVAGIEHVGLGSDFDGIDTTPAGLDGVDKFPALLEELMRRGWSDAEIAKLAGENLLRVFAGAEAVAARLATRPASGATIAALDRVMPAK